MAAGGVISACFELGAPSRLVQLCLSLSLLNPSSFNCSGILMCLGWGLAGAGVTYSHLETCH